MSKISVTKKAIICGYYGQNNVGDDALLISLLAMLPSHIKPLVLSGNPQKTQEQLQVEALPNRSAFPNSHQVPLPLAIPLVIPFLKELPRLQN
ncbi:hypothetical protein [Euhalothece natronophila]|uniref:hypothetical protein n=1 Tax=Euhalothece natronophila TaxID=577489 RepID=UPI0016458C33